MGNLELIAPHLINIKYLSMYIKGDADMAMAWCEMYHSLFSQVTKITELHIFEASEASDDPGIETYTDVKSITLGHIHDHARQLHLKMLVLFGLQLGNFYTQITDHLYVMRLSTLVLDQCQGIQPLMRGLTAACAKETPALRVLEIYLVFQDQEHEEGMLKDIEDFLLSFSGLKELNMELENYGMVSKASILNHKATVQLLAIGSRAGAPNKFAAAELNDVLLQCTSLQQLALPLDIGVQDPWTDMGRDSLGLSGVILSVTRTNTDLTRSLIVLAAHPTLRNVRVFDHPFLAWDNMNVLRWAYEPLDRNHTGIAAAAMQNIASQLFSYLAQWGFKLKVLAFAPDDVVSRGKRPDYNGNFWPHHAYLTGKTIHRQGKDCVVAMPLAQVMEEMSGSTILDGCPW